MIDYLHQNIDACQLLMLDVEFGSKNGLMIMKDLREQKLKCSLIINSKLRNRYLIDIYSMGTCYLICMFVEIID